MDKIIVYKVCVKELCLGMRIENVYIWSYMFTDREKALQFAYSEALDYNENIMDEKEKQTLTYNPNGTYCWPSDQYPCWNDYIIYMETSVIDLTSDIINISEFST